VRERELTEEEKMATAKKYKIASVCGAGLATSTWIANKLTQSLAERGIEADITEMKIMDLALSAGNFDLIVSASNLGNVYDVPVVVSTSILTGIGFEDTVDEIVEILKGKEGE
jgi:PTS system galactitol-specific IIB component